MKISVEFDVSVLDSTAQRYEKNLAFSVAQALNDCVKDAQARARAQMREVFTIRKPDFVDKRIKIFAFASVKQDRTFAEIGIDQKERLLLSLLQTGGARPPFTGRAEAVPITGNAARPSFADSVPSNMRFNSLNFGMRGTFKPSNANEKRRRTYRGSAKSWKGNQRTFILTHTRTLPSGGVFQRTGPKRADVRLLYAFKPHVQVRKMLTFIEIALASANKFGDYFNQHFFRLK